MLRHVKPSEWSHAQVSVSATVTVLEDGRAVRAAETKPVGNSVPPIEKAGPAGDQHNRTPASEQMWN